MSVRRILLTKLRRDAVRQRWQFVAVVVTVVLGIMLFAASFDAFRNLTGSYQQTYERLAFADMTVSGGDQESFRASAAALDSVDVAQARLQADVPFEVPLDNGGSQGLVGRVVGMPVASQPQVNKVDVIAGSYLDPATPNGVLVETHMAEHFGLKPGDTFAVLLDSGYTQVQMLGEAASAEYIWPARSRQDVFPTQDDFGVVFVPSDLAARAPPATLVEQSLLLYAADADRQATDEEVTGLALAASADEITNQEDQPSNAALSEDLQGFGEISVMFPALFLTGAGLATFIILNRLVSTQRGQIGTLAANGLSRRQILRHYLSYGLITGLGGAVIGLVIGIPLGSLTTSAYTTALSIPDTVTSFYPVTVVVGLLFGVVMGVLAAWAPARAAVSIPPAQAMRGEVPATTGTLSLIERVVPPLQRAPIRWRMTLRGIGRKKTRSASTVGGVAMAIVLVLASWGMIDTITLLMDRQFSDIQHQNAQAVLGVPVTADSVAMIAGVEGVASAEGVVTTSVTVQADGVQYATTITGFMPATQMHSFYDDHGTEIPLPEDGVLLGIAMQDLLDIEVGDPVRLSFPSLGTDLDSVVGGFVDEPLGTLAYADRDALASDLGAAGVPVAQLAGPATASVMTIYDPAADPDTVLQSLRDQADVLAVTSSTAIRDLFEGFLALFYVFIGVMLLFGGLLAFALIFNMVSVNIAERAAELAMMRSNGLSLTEINRMMTVENVLLTLIGIPIGLVLGYLVAAGFMASFTSDLFQFNLEVRPATYLFIAIAILAVALLSQIPGLRAVRRLDIASVVRERSL